jgi:hypothetical protein
MRHPNGARVLAVLFILFPFTTRAQWPANGVSLTGAGSAVGTIAACADSSGGAIVAWTELKSGQYDVFARRVSASGVPMWTADGVVVCAATFDQTSPVICPDGTGGAIIAWRDHRSGSFDIYAQRLDAHGAPQWTANGVAVCDIINNQYAPAITPDGSGGAIVVWYDFRALNYDIYAQRIDANGVTQWTFGGIGLCSAQYNQNDPVIVGDGAGGAVVAWTDVRNGNADIFARRVNAAGVGQWTANGTALCLETHSQVSPVAVTDETGGAIVAWRDLRAGNSDVYAQRIDGAGTVSWTANGVAVCSAALEQLHVNMIPDGAGGALLAWDDVRAGTADIFAQRVNASGAAQWSPNGAVVCSAIGNQTLPWLSTDGASGAIVSWQDARGANADIYAQRIDATGATAWASNGIALCNATAHQTAPVSCAVGSGGAVAAWIDARAGNTDVYAHRVDGGGGGPTGIPTATPRLAISRGYPNPFSDTIRFEMTSDRPGRVRLEVFDVAGRRVATRINGDGAIEFDGRDDQGRPLPGGIYLCRLSAGGASVVRKVTLVR